MAGAAAPTFSPAQAQETIEDTALALPRLAAPGGAAVALPRPLPAAIARLVRQAFKDPAAPLDGLDANPVLGHILADRFLAAAARPTPDDLRAWLATYPGLPDAPAVHALLLTRQPRTAPAPPPPILSAFTAAPIGDDIETTDRLLPRNPALDRTIRDAARAGQFERALHLVARTKGITPEYAALLRAEIARAMFSQGRDLDALDLAEAAHQQARTVGLAPWVGGLAAWRLGRLELARTLFDAAWRAPLAAPGQRAGAAYWSARVSLVTRGHRGPWMDRAATDARTFYGLLARRVLGQPIRPETPFQHDTLATADIEAIETTPRGQRAFILLQVGEPARAAAELRQLFTDTRDQPGFGRSILLVARTAQLDDLAGQLGAVMQPASVRLPLNRLRPAGGFKLDPALVYAITRMESNFDTDAISPAGARGLMQLMPTTAEFVMAGTGRAPSLHDPAANLEVGQRYLLALARLDLVGDNLIRLLTTYNAGPGNVAKWLDVMLPEEDPLLFMEALPGEETRAYVPRVLAYSWLYAAQLGLPSASLDEMAAGLWPRVQVRTTQHQPAARLH